MKKTPDDDAFASAFGRELYTAYTEFKQAGRTDQEFANSIGVARAQLDKYLTGGPMPSLRTVVLAYENHGIAISYRTTHIPTLARARQRKRKLPQGEEQFSFPFVIRRRSLGM